MQPTRPQKHGSRLTHNSPFAEHPSQACSRIRRVERPLPANISSVSLLSLKAKRITVFLTYTAFEAISGGIRLDADPNCGPRQTVDGDFTKWTY